MAWWAAAAQAAPSELNVYLPGGDEKKVEAVPGDDRYAVRIVSAKFNWPPADCAGVCVTFEAFEKSARRTGTLMRVYTKDGNFRRDREVDFLPQISADAVKDHLDSLLIIVHSILHEVTLPSAEVALPPPQKAPADGSARKGQDRTSDMAADAKPAAVVEADESVSPVAKEKAQLKAKAKEPPAPAYRFPFAVSIGSDWLTGSMAAPAIGIEAGARLPYGVAAFLAYRYRFGASFDAGTGTLSAIGQRYVAAVGTYLPQFRKFEVGVFFTPEIESVEFTSDVGTVRHGNLFLVGGELRLLYRAQPELGVQLSVGAQYVTNRIRVEYQGGTGLFETEGVSTGIQGGMYYEFPLPGR